MNLFLLYRLTANWGVGCSRSFNQFITRNKMHWMHFRFFDDLVGLAQLNFCLVSLTPLALMTCSHWASASFIVLLAAVTRARFARDLLTPLPVAAVVAAAEPPAGAHEPVPPTGVVVGACARFERGRGSDSGISSARCARFVMLNQTSSFKSFGERLRSASRVNAKEHTITQN